MPAGWHICPGLPEEYEKKGDIQKTSLCWENLLQLSDFGILGGMFVYVGHSQEAGLARIPNVSSILKSFP